MIVATAQPYFAPFCGFFFKAARADVLVVLDTVQFPRGFSWLTRNRFKNDQGTFWMSLPVWRKGLGLQRIDQVNLCWKGNWPRKHSAALKAAYANAPHLSAQTDFLESIFDGRYERLLELNLAVIQHMKDCFEIGTRLVRLSELGISGHGSGLLIRICKVLEAECFVGQRPARKFLDEAAFRAEGIEVRFIDPPTPVYPQLWGDFLPGLSALDLILNCGPMAPKILFGEK